MDITISTLKQGKKSFLVLETKTTISLQSSNKNIDNEILLKVTALNELKIYHELLFGIALSNAYINNKEIKLYIPVVYMLNGDIRIFIYEYLKTINYPTSDFLINIMPQYIYFYTSSKVTQTSQGTDFYIFSTDLDVHEIDLSVKNEPYIVQKDIIKIKGKTKVNSKYEGMVRGLSVFDSYFQDIYLPCVYEQDELTIYNYNYNPDMKPEFFNLNSQTVYLL